MLVSHTELGTSLGSPLTKGEKFHESMPQILSQLKADLLSQHCLFHVSDKSSIAEYSMEFLLYDMLLKTIRQCWSNVTLL